MQRQEQQKARPSSRRSANIAATLAAICTLVTVLYYANNGLSPTVYARQPYNGLSPTVYARQPCKHLAPSSRADGSEHWAPYYRRETGGAGKSDSPRILLWLLKFGEYVEGLSENVTEVRQTCPRSQCFITYDRSALLSSDAVVIHGPDINMNDMPKYRHAGQKWVYWTMEHPGNCGPLEFLNNTFNWTMSYRSDSDILYPYQATTERKTKQSYQYQKTWKTWRRKSEMVVWPVSHCSTPSRREAYVRQLRENVSVHVYGMCGGLKCPRENTTKCFEMFAKKYFFYLSFENSICKDYVTEKLFDVLNYDIIPVVLGGANYTAIAPPDSFIDALSFKSPKHLAEYLKQVAGDFELYAKYLRWKTTHTVGPVRSFCDLCDKLHSPSFRQTTVIPDMFHWVREMARCRSWSSED